jgi:hypothetical protein
MSTEGADFVKKLLDLAFKSRGGFQKADRAHWANTLHYIKTRTAEANLSVDHPLLARLKGGEYELDTSI